MIIQPYAFKGDDFDAVYAKARQFCARLHEAGISPMLPDGFRSNTKTYPDYGRSVTVIEVFPGISVSEQFEIAEKIYTDVMTEPEPTDEYIAESRRIIHGLPLTLEYDKDEGWRLTDTSGDPETVFWGTGNTRTVLEKTHKYACVLSGADPDITRPALLGAPTPSGDDFDPFLDSDDLP